MESFISNFYLKCKLAEGIEIRVELTDENVFTRCPECGTEIQVDADMLKFIYTEGDIYGTSFYCDKCIEKR